MDDPTLTPLTLAPTPGGTSRAVAPHARPHRTPRPARPRAATTVSAAILTDRGLAEGYVALPLARLMAHRVWESVDTLNQQLVLLERNCFTRMTSDQTFKTQGAAFAQLLQAYAALTEEVAALAQRLAQNRLTDADRLALASGHLTLLLPRADPVPPPSPSDPTLVSPSAASAAAGDAGPASVPDPAVLAPPVDLPALPPAANGATHEDP